MKEVVKKIGELHDMLVEKTNKLNKLIGETTAFNSELIERASALSASEKRLTEREMAVRQIENSVDLNAEAVRLMAQVDKERIALEEARLSWRTACDIEKQNLNSQREILDQETKNNEANRKSLEEEVTKRVNELFGKMRK
jgi:hypothetical protein